MKKYSKILNRENLLENLELNVWAGGNSLRLLRF